MSLGLTSPVVLFLGARTFGYILAEQRIILPFSVLVYVHPQLMAPDITCSAC